MLQKRKFQTVFVIALICWLCFFLPSCTKNEERGTEFKIVKTNLPPNYKILCKNGKFVTSMPGGTRLYKSYPYIPFDNYQDAIDKAWEQYDFKSPKPDTVNWVNCETQSKK